MTASSSSLLQSAPRERRIVTFVSSVAAASARVDAAPAAATQPTPEAASPANEIRYVKWRPRPRVEAASPAEVVVSEPAEPSIDEPAAPPESSARPTAPAKKRVTVARPRAATALALGDDEVAFRQAAVRLVLEAGVEGARRALDALAATLSDLR